MRRRRNDDIGASSRCIGKRSDGGHVAELGAQLFDVAEIEGAQRARLDADGLLALGHAVLAAVALHTMARTTVDVRREIRA